jgi:hypothetical protein
MIIAQVTAAYTARARTLVTKMMFWALAGVTFSAAKIVSCNKNFFFMVYLRHYFNCSTLVPNLNSRSLSMKVDLRKECVCIQPDLSKVTRSEQFYGWLQN